MRDFGRADAERIGAESAMRGRVAVAADDQQARQRQSLFGTDHMHDALARIVEPEQRDMPLSSAFVSRLRTIARDFRIGDAVPRGRASARSGRRRRR